MPTPAPHGHGTNRLAPHRRFWPRRVPFDLPAAQTTLWDNLDISARRYPDKPAFVFFGRALSFAQLRAQAQRLAGWLHSKAGVREGDLVLEVNRKAVGTIKSYEHVAASLPKDQAVLLLLKRQGRAIYLTLRP